MSKTKEKRRFKLNIFDAVVLLVVLVVGAYFVWNALKPDDSATIVTNTSTVRYTILIQAAEPGTGELVAEGDLLEDTLKNYSIGAVVSAETLPATTPVIDNINAKKVTAVIPGKEDIRITVEASATESDSQIIVGSGYELRIGTRIFVRGPGWLGGGYVVDIEREGTV